MTFLKPLSAIIKSHDVARTAVPAPLGPCGLSGSRRLWRREGDENVDQGMERR